MQNVNSRILKPSGKSVCFSGTQLYSPAGGAHAPLVNTKVKPDRNDALSYRIDLISLPASSCSPIAMIY